MKKTLALPLHFLNENKKVDFDIFVWAAGKPILYCRKNDSHLSERIKKLKSKKNLKYFLVLEEDYSSFITYLSQGLEETFSKGEEQSLKEQCENIYYQQRGLLIALSADPKSKEYYSILRSTCSSFYEFFHKDDDRLRAFLTTELHLNEFDIMLTHLLRVAALTSRLIFETQNDQAGKPVFDVIMGAFLHDFSYFEKPWDFTSPDYTKDPHFKDHPLEGIELLSEEHLNPWVRSVIVTHEEHIDGSGIPNGISEEEFDPILQCVGVANAFDRLYTLQKKTYDGALKQLLIDKMGAYPLPTLQKLQTVIKNVF